MPKLERLDWITPLEAGRGVTLTNDPEADRFLEENPNALLFGVLYDSQYQTRRAFAIPLRLRERIGHFDITQIAEMDPELLGATFRQKPALHRFPNRYAALSQQLARVLTDRYEGDAANLWRKAHDLNHLAQNIMALPAFGVEKTNWTVGMLGRLGLVQFDGWEEFRAVSTTKSGRPVADNPA